MRFALGLGLLLAVTAPAASFATDAHPREAAIPTVTVKELQALLSAKEAQAVDANNASTREKYGTIPGSVLLSAASTYEPAKELPNKKDAKLVFYCANPKCSASHQAAKRAAEAGYTAVSVFSDGIMGWKQAGAPTSTVPKS